MATVHNSAFWRAEYSSTNVGSILNLLLAEHQNAVNNPNSPKRYKDEVFANYRAVNNILVLAGKFIKPQFEKFDPLNNKPLGDISLSSKQFQTYKDIAIAASINTQSFQQFCMEIAKIQVDGKSLVIASTPTIFGPFWQVNLSVNGEREFVSYKSKSWMCSGVETSQKTLLAALQLRFPESTVTESSIPKFPIKSEKFFVHLVNKTPLIAITEETQNEIIRLEQELARIQKRYPDPSQEIVNEINYIKNLTAKYVKFLSNSTVFETTSGFLTDRTCNRELPFTVTSRQLVRLSDIISGINYQTNQIYQFSDAVNMLGVDVIVKSPLQVNIELRYDKSSNRGRTFIQSSLSIRLALPLNGKTSIFKIDQSETNGEISYTTKLGNIKDESSFELKASTIQELLDQLSNVRCEDGVCSLPESETLDSEIEELTTEFEVQELVSPELESSLV